MLEPILLSSPSMMDNGKQQGHSKFADDTKQGALSGVLEAP